MCDIWWEEGRKEEQYVYYAIEDIIAIVLKGTCHIQCHVHVFGGGRILDFAIIEIAPRSGGGRIQ